MEYSASTEKGKTNARIQSQKSPDELSSSRAAPALPDPVTAFDLLERIQEIANHRTA